MELSETPEYQRTLEDLVAKNALLKHEASELVHQLGSARDENRVLREELDQLRSVVNVAGRISPLTNEQRLFTEISRLSSQPNYARSFHSRTESSPVVGSFVDTSFSSRAVVHSRAGSVAIASKPTMSAWEHHRRSSYAPSIASSSTGEVGVLSPSLMSPGQGLGLGTINSDGNSFILREESVGPQSPDVRQSPRSATRVASPGHSGGIPYHLNGVPKSKPTRPRPLSRNYSIERRSSTMRSMGVEAITEWASADDERSGAGTTTDDPEPMSPGNDYFHSTDPGRIKHGSVLLNPLTMSPHGSSDASPNPSMMDATSDVASGGGELWETPKTASGVKSSPRNSPRKRVTRRTLLLLSRSVGVQTDSTDEPIPGAGTPASPAVAAPPPVSATASKTTEERSETSSMHDAADASVSRESKGGHIVLLVEYLGKILSRLRGADIPTLNRRLKKQHLPGDVGHLSRSTMRSLQNEIFEMRQLFRGQLEQSGMSRREVTLLLKLLKDTFSDLVELQSIVNDVTIDPSLAKKLQRDAYRPEGEVDDKAARAGGGLGWIAAPITKFFVNSSSDATGDGNSAEATATPPSPRPGQRAGGRLQPTAPVRQAPKLQASTSATTTHISVEFGVSGMVRRATYAPPVHNPPHPPAPADALPPSPNAFQDVPAPRAVSMPAPRSSNGLAPPVPTLRQVKSRANRNELLGIFAGAPQSHSNSGGSWVVVGSPNNSTLEGGNPRLRHANSQYFSGRGGAPATARHKRLSSIVDAVIDASTDAAASAVHDDDDENDVIEGTYDPGLLERTLRPRGLSDSSIRSTVRDIEYSHPVLSGQVSIPTPATRVTTAPRGMLGTSLTGGSMFESFKRLYPFRTVEPIASASTIDAGTDTTKTVSMDEETAEVPVTTIPIAQTQATPVSTTALNIARSPARPIPAILGVSPHAHHLLHYQSSSGKKFIA